MVYLILFFLAGVNVGLLIAIAIQRHYRKRRMESWKSCAQEVGEIFKDKMQDKNLYISMRPDTFLSNIIYENKPDEDNHEPV